MFRSAPIVRHAVLLFAFAWAITAKGQSKPLFTGEDKLEPCRVELPLTYSAKDKERYTAQARLLEGQELVYLTYDKKLGKATYDRVFVVVDVSSDGTEFVYLEESEQHMVMGGVKQAMFPKFKASRQRFYNADCFDERMVAEPSLKEVVVPK